MPTDDHLPGVGEAGGEGEVAHVLLPVGVEEDVAPLPAAGTVPGQGQAGNILAIVATVTVCVFVTEYVDHLML